MRLESTVYNLDSVPEALREFYTQDGDKFVLDVGSPRNRHERRQQKKYLRFSDLQKEGLFKHRMTLKRLVENYGFPPGRLISPSMRVWTREEVDDWFDGRPTRMEEYEGEALNEE